MSSTSELRSSDRTRTYDRASSVVFLKTNEPFGGLSNMAGGYPLHVQGVRILTSEALYQACRFPHFPEVQRLIIEQASPMTAKMKSKPHRKDSRADWDQVRVKVMRWCLRVKLAQNWSTFSELLLRTGDRPIVEESRKDDFWGAKPVDERTLVGMNVLGRLLMELREAVKSGGHDAFLHVEPPTISNFMLFGRPIDAIAGRGVATVAPVEGEGTHGAGADAGSRTAEQASLFDQPVAREGPPPVYVSVYTEHARLARLKPYPAMKDSGVEWLGDVPEHWEVKRLKLAVHLTDKKIEADEENPVPYIGMENIESWTGRLLPIKPDVVPTGTANAFKAGHTLFGKLRPYLAKACNPDFDGLCSTELLVLKGAELAPRALLYSLLSDGFIKLVDSSTYGSKMPRASWDFVGNCVVPIAPPDEQRTVADFLDRETAKIDALVAKKRTLIERLKEKRAALISRTVSRGLPPDAARAAGLDPHPKLKLSGIDWLGDVPEHWEVTKGRFLGALLGSIAIEEDETNEDDEGTPYAKVDDLNYVDSSLLLKRTKLSVSDVVTPHKRMLLFPKRGAAIFTNKVVLADGRYLFDSNLMGWEISHRADLKFVAHCLIARRLDDLADVSTVPQINNKHIYPAQFPRPPLPEQRAIAAFLDHETAKIDDMMSQVETAIERLQEYRTALITAAVTGKIDVRGQSADNGRVLANAS